MKDNGLRHNKKKGVALIISVGILALIAMIATSFAINMQVDFKASQNYLNSETASALAEAGIEKAITDIRGYVRASGYPAVLNAISINYPDPAVEVPLGNGTYQVTVTREDNYVAGGPRQKINVNTMDATDYIWIDSLVAAGLTNDDVAKIIDYQDFDSTVTTKLLTANGVVNVTGSEGGAKNAPYATVEELRQVLNDDAKFNAIRDIVTVYTPIKIGGLIGKYYADRHTFDPATILDLSNFKGKVIEIGRVDQCWGTGESSLLYLPGH